MLLPTIRLTMATARMFLGAVAHERVIRRNPAAQKNVRNGRNGTRKRLGGQGQNRMTIAYKVKARLSTSRLRQDARTTAQTASPSPTGIGHGNPASSAPDGNCTVAWAM